LQRAQARLGIVEPLRPLFVEMENIEVGFGNIDANGMIRHLHARHCS
jgi:hypothetical protein